MSEPITVPELHAVGSAASRSASLLQRLGHGLRAIWAGYMRHLERCAGSLPPP